nr:uncharacterized GPI-anchored protein At3g06035-like [Ipomoea batatas]
MDKCGIDGSTTKDDMVLSVCVRKRVPTPVPTNYTQSLQNAKYLNDSKYTGVGIGTEDDWTVLVLTTNTQTGMFAAATAAAYVTICKCVNPVFPLNYSVETVKLCLVLPSREVAAKWRLI